MGWRELGVRAERAQGGVKEAVGVVGAVGWRVERGGGGGGRGGGRFERFLRNFRREASLCSTYRPGFAV